MSEVLTPKEIASAAAQGVAIALGARKPRPGAVKEELFIPPRIICGIPPAIFEVELTPNPSGGFSSGVPRATQG